MTTVHIILLIILIACLFLTYIGKAAESDGFFIAGFVLTFICFVVGGIIDNIPKIKHEQLILNCEKAENNLEKFYTKHPEFKEAEE